MLRSSTMSSGSELHLYAVRLGLWTVRAFSLPSCCMSSLCYAAYCMHDASECAVWLCYWLCCARRQECSAIPYWILTLGGIASVTSVHTEPACETNTSVPCTSMQSCCRTICLHIHLYFDIPNPYSVFHICTLILCIFAGDAEP